MPSVAILAAGLGVVVAPWHGHHAQHIPALGRTAPLL